MNASVTHLREDIDRDTNDQTEQFPIFRKSNHLKYNFNEHQGTESQKIKSRITSPINWNFTKNTGRDKKATTTTNYEISEV